MKLIKLSNCVQLPSIGNTPALVCRKPRVWHRKVSPRVDPMHALLSHLRVKSGTSHPTSGSAMHALLRQRHIYKDATKKLYIQCFTQSTYELLSYESCINHWYRHQRPKTLEVGIHISHEKVISFILKNNTTISLSLSWPPFIPHTHIRKKNKMKHTKFPEKNI